jgi:hypothetical protein
MVDELKRHFDEPEAVNSSVTAKVNECFHDFDSKEFWPATLHPNDRAEISNVVSSARLFLTEAARKNLAFVNKAWTEHPGEVPIPVSFTESNREFYRALSDFRRQLEVLRR